VSLVTAGHGAGRFRYGATLALALAIALFALIAPDRHGAWAVELVAAAGMLFLAVITSRAPQRTRRVAGAVLVVAALAVALGAGLGHVSSAVALGGIAVLLAATVAVLITGLVRLVIERGVVLQAVFGAVAIYVLLGLTFAFVIGAVATAISAPYFASGTDGTQSARVYFSFTSLTTTGYGDLTAATRGGRALAVLEMLVGQLYLVTVIATLVGNLRRRPS
jgi:Ion channel